MNKLIAKFRCGLVGHDWTGWHIEVYMFAYFPIPFNTNRCKRCGKCEVRE